MKSNIPDHLKTYRVKVDPDYPHFGIIEDPKPHNQHPNQQGGLDLYVTVLNMATGERCFKKLYKNTKGLHFKHTGFSTMYLEDFTEEATVVEHQVLFDSGSHLVITQNG